MWRHFISNTGIESLSAINRQANWIVISLLLSSCGDGGNDLASPAESEAGSRPNIVVIVTDDQRWNTFGEMPHTAEIFSRGIAFSSSYITTPVCSPARASFISGGFYAHNNGQLGNIAPNGGWEAFDDRQSLPVLLQRAGYVTAFSGKYLNGFYSLFAGNEPLIPAGWDYFVGTDVVRKPVVSWMDSVFIRGTSDADRGRGTRGAVSGKYITYAQRDYALDFLNHEIDRPFFLMVSFDAPHSPALLPPEDEFLYESYSYSERSFEEEDISDKPTMPRSVGDRYSRGFDIAVLPARQLASLQSVDRAVASIVARLEELEQLDNTVIFYFSDNGLLWGEHRLTGKTQPYEESVRTPMYALAPDAMA